VPLPPLELPIQEVLPAIRSELARSSRVVVQAPAGAGKSTLVPLALLDEPWMRARRLLMLEPRRLAARAVAQRMAHLLGEPVGRTVGYRMRLDTRVSRATRIEVITEGVLTRMLQTDPALDGVAAVIFDEFHERSLQADLGLAFALEAQATIAPELRLLIMSATLDGEALAKWWQGPPPITAQGRVFPVEVRYCGTGAPLLPAEGGDRRSGESLEQVAAKLVRRALREERGDVLVFLPGAREIRRVQGLLREGAPEAAVAVLPLLGELSQAEQEAALRPAAAGRRVVLATNIAETSLTIEGIRVVVDSGVVRRSVFDPVTGMSRLETRRISRASADQRQGRAGRLESGICYRAWSEGAHRTLAAFTTPEILEIDLTTLTLELAAWGARDPGALCWLDTPPAALVASARDLLQSLEALDDSGCVTDHGRSMARLGTHPRLAHMLLRSRTLGKLESAARLAALLSEPDLLRGDAGPRDADIRSRLERVASSRAGGAPSNTIARIRRGTLEFLRQLGDPADRSADARQDWSDSVGPLLAFAYPDRIAQRRAGAEMRYLLANGRGAQFAEPQTLGHHELIVAVELDDREREARILLAAPLTKAELLEQGRERLRRKTLVEWSEREAAVIAREQLCLDAIVLEEKPLREVPLEATRAAMLEGIRRLGISALAWSRSARELQARMEFIRALEPPGTPDAIASRWPCVNDATLMQTLEGWLAPWLDGVTRREHLTRIPLVDALRALLSREQQRQLDELAPTHVQVPSGSRVPVDYIDESAPVVSVRLQEVFGLAATPRIAGGKVPVTFKLLSPAQRPVQITRDLASFWRGAYAEVRKDLRGRYPKHYWPENPLEAQATRRVRPRNDHSNKPPKP
jgi:ATP-dependent helicase HrpB